MEETELKFEDLYLRYNRRLLAVCRRYSSCNEKAKDAFQEGLLKIYQNLDKYKGIGSLDGWLYRIMRNVSIDYDRRWSSKTTCMIDSVSSIKDDWNLFEEIFSFEFYEKDLMHMPIELKEVLRLFAKGYTHDEISKLLNININTSRSRLFRAKYYIRNNLKYLQSR